MNLLVITACSHNGSNAADSEKQCYCTHSKQFPTVCLHPLSSAALSSTTVANLIAQTLPARYFHKKLTGMRSDEHGHIQRNSLVDQPICLDGKITNC